MTKKLFVTATLFIGMIAGAMVFSSFKAPKEEKSTETTSITISDGWTRVGSYYGYKDDGTRSRFQFIVWEKAGMCNAYYWTYDCFVGGPNDPDHTSATGVLRQNSAGKWYAAYNGDIWFIDF